MTSLLLSLKHIPEEGLKLDEELHREDLALSEDDAPIRGLIILRRQVDKTVSGVRASGYLDGVFEQSCVRCLEPFREAFHIPFAAMFKSETTQESAQVSGSVDEAAETEEDVYPIQADQVDLRAMLREQVILGLPVHPLCRTDCQGLCPVCGKNRNVITCSCVLPEQPSPFSVLKTLMKRDQQPQGPSRGAGRK